jgi:ribosomal-protein-serine acetyltransferase
MERGITCTRHDHINIRVDGDIELRGACVADCAELYAAIDRNREHLRQWLPWVRHDFNEDDLRNFLAAKEADNAARISLTTHIRYRGELCGAIGLHNIDRMHRNTSVGYWIGKAFSGRGIVTRACHAIVAEGFRNYDLHRIEIRCATANTLSSAIPKRLGFRQEGLLREAEWLYDHWVDLLVFGMLEPDWTTRARD